MRKYIYSTSGKRGIDDLFNPCPYYTDEYGYRSFHSAFPDVTEEDYLKDIDGAYVRRVEIQNRNYIMSLQLAGTYGEKYYSTVETLHNPMFDVNDPAQLILGPTPASESYKIIFLDFNNEDTNGTMGERPTGKTRG